MEPIGLILQQARQQKKLKLEMVSEETKINVRYLKALEAEDWNVFSSPVYARAFLRNYANFLGLDSDGLVQEYKKYFEVLLQIPIPEKRILKKIGLFSAIFSMAILIGWGGWFFLSRPGPSPVDKISGEKSPAILPGEKSPAILPGEKSPAILPGKKSPIVLKAVAKQEVWVSIAIDNGEESQELLETGFERSWEAKQRLKIKVGNAGGIELELNGKPVGSLGERGEVVTRTFGREGYR